MTDTKTITYTLNTADIVFEEYSDETVLANMREGLYYTLNLTGADFFRALIMAPNQKVAERWLQQIYQEDRGAIERLLHTFAVKLVEESILIAADAEQLDPDDSPLPAALNSGKKTLGEPELVHYSDVEELLKLEPVHEVEHESGWPTLTENSS